MGWIEKMPYFPKHDNSPLAQELACFSP